MLGLYWDTGILYWHTKKMWMLGYCMNLFDILGLSWHIHGESSLLINYEKQPVSG
jgi:hypothetical protein